MHPDLTANNLADARTLAVALAEGVVALRPRR
jgi:hypothetical protein